MCTTLTITVREIKPDARRIRGVLMSPHAVAPTQAQTDEAPARHLRGRQSLAGDREQRGR